MNPNEFVDAVRATPFLAGPISRSGMVVSPPMRDSSRTASELAAIVVMYPLVRYAITQIGLPWLYEARRYSELWRVRLHEWIDEQCRTNGYNPKTLARASEALRRELEAVTDAKARQSWERLASALSRDRKA